MPDKCEAAVTDTKIRKWISPVLTGQFADEPTRGESSRGLVNSRIILADSEF